MKLIPYKIEYFEQVIEIFKSNIPKFFHHTELNEFINFLKHPDIEYFILEDNGVIVGAGGIGLNEDQSVSLCWGMIDKRKQSNRFGEFLLLERIKLINNKFPKHKIISNTSQLTEQFFEKYGFITIQSDEDYWAPGIHLRKMVLKA